MKRVQRSEILDYVTYSEIRKKIQEDVLPEKKARRIQLGEHLSFLFENTNTIRYQIQEMIRVEKLVKEESIQRELDTYNDLLGDRGELGCVLLVEFLDENERDEMLRKLHSLPKHLFLRLENGNKVYPRYDKSQMDEEKISAVQFLKFKCPFDPVAIGCDHPLMNLEQTLSPEQKKILRKDLTH